MIKWGGGEIIVLPFVLSLLFPGILKAENPSTASALEYDNFERWGIKFEYPKGWKERSAEEINIIKIPFSKHLETLSSTLAEFTVLEAPDQEAGLTILKIIRQNPVTAQEMLEEREKAFKDARAQGDFIKINQLESGTIDNKPAVVEDVERDNGARGYTIRVISDKTIIEIALLSSKGAFPDYKPILDRIIETFKLFDKPT